VHSRWLLLPQLLNIGLCPLGGMGMPFDIEKLRQPNVERRQDCLYSPNATQQLIVDDLLTRIGVEMSSV
jgi:hypothetical protein